MTANIPRYNCCQKNHLQHTTQVETEKWDKEYALDLLNNPLTSLHLYLATSTRNELLSIWKNFTVGLKWGVDVIDYADYVN